MVDFTKFPFGLTPISSKAMFVNDILKDSYNLQKQLLMTNACAFVNIILQRCFKAADIETEIIYGILDYGSYLIPHVWLTIDGTIVDNTYAMHIPENLFVISKSTAKYINEEPSESNNKCFLGDEETRSKGGVDHNIKLFKWVLNNQDQALVMSFNKLQIQHYYTMMTRFMKDKYNVTVPAFVPPNHYCWKCQTEASQLKSCARCKVSKYCSKQCQKNDWKEIHKIACLEPNRF